MNYQPLSEQDQADFYHAVLAATRSAEAATPPSVVPVEIAATRVNLVFAGAALQEALLPALAHLVVDDDTEASSTIHVWDTASTGVTMPPPPCSRDRFTYRGDLWGFTSPRYRTAFHWEEFSVNVMDLETGVGAFWVRDGARLPYWSKASPFRTLLHWCLGRNGAQLLHAAAIGDGSGAVLVTGKGGVGKSSTALAALTDGLSYLGDDYVAIRLDNEPAVHSVYSTAKLDAHDVERYPELLPHVRNPLTMHDEKAVIALHPAFAAQLSRGMRLRAVVAPRVVESGATSFAPVDSIVLRQAAIFTTLSQLPYADQRVQAFVEGALEKAPGLELRLGSRRDVAGAVRALLDLSDEKMREMSMQPLDSSAQRHVPLVSVVLPVFNGAHFLSDAVNSILAQEYPRIEIIVVDDGSTDDIETAVRQLPVAVEFIRQPNSGPAAARNRGLAAAGGELISFLDVDDLWHDGALATLSATLIANHTLLVAHGHSQIVTLNSVTGALEQQGNPAETFPYSIGGALYRRAVFDRAGLFDETMRFGEDSDWFLRLREMGIPVARIPQVTMLVRRHAGNMTGAKSDVELTATTLPVFKRMLDRARRAGGEGPAQAATGPES